MKYILYNGEIVTGRSVRKGIIIIDGEIIEDVIYDDENTPIIYKELQNYPDYTPVDLDGCHIFSGGIDVHVHFREPGMTHKADMESESKAALSGGVTSFVDMPNTNPPTVSAMRIGEKISIAEKTSYANYGFHIGATNSNYEEIDEILTKGKDGICGRDFGGIKVFMGSSTGNMLMDDTDILSKIFKIKDKEILVHCEDETTIKNNLERAVEEYGEDIPFGKHPEIRSRRACILSSIKALELAMKYGTRLHLLHISTKEEVEMVRAAKQSNKNITAETSANYLYFSDRDYQRLGAKMKCNPAIKGDDDRIALRNALKEGIIDTIGSDHAPHTEKEKEGKYLATPSGIPSIGQSFNVLLTAALEEGIPLERVASAFSEKPAEIFGIKDRGFIEKGRFADIVAVDLGKDTPVIKESLAGKCGWSPYEGSSLKGQIKYVFVNGTLAVEDGTLKQSALPLGKRLSFEY